MDKIFLVVLILGLPLSVIGSLFHWPAILMFIIYCVTIIAIASFMGKATENLSIVAGPRIGGLLNATFGNAVELIIGIFSLQAGLNTIVLASMTGSIIGNLLLVGGLSFFIGGLRYKRQQFNIYDARHNSGLLVFGVIVAFLFPKVFSLEISSEKALTLSIWISVIMILLYMATLFFKLVTHRGVYKSKADEVENPDEKAEWGLWKSIIILAVLTAAVSYVSENLVHTFKDVAEKFGWSEIFIGVIIVAIIGNAAEHASAIIMAYKNRMGVAQEIAVGSTLQVAMFVAPILVLVSLLFPTPMALLFSVPELVAMVLAVFLTIMVTSDADTNWFEGMTLMAAYLIMGVGFYLL